MAIGPFYRQANSSQEAPSPATNSSLVTEYLRAHHFSPRELADTIDAMQQATSEELFVDQVANFLSQDVARFIWKLNDADGRF
jgi:hypothetical protein